MIKWEIRFLMLDEVYLPEAFSWEAVTEGVVRAALSDDYDFHDGEAVYRA